MIPPKQIQYHVFHCPAVCAAAFCTAPACALRKANTVGGTLDNAVSWAENGAISGRLAEMFQQRLLARFNDDQSRGKNQEQNLEWKQPLDGPFEESKK